MSISEKEVSAMTRYIIITRKEYNEDRQGRTFSDVLDDPEQPFDDILAFFNDAQRQRRMEESEIHHDRAALSGVVRELEAQPAIDRFLGSQDPRRTKRLRQAVGVVVRMIMEQRGWKKTGRKGSLGVRATVVKGTATPGAYHNTGGLAFWFLRAERYERIEGMPFRAVRDRAEESKEEAKNLAADHLWAAPKSKP
ncbi:MAG: hypothetical protein JXM70_09565 [Pirellulales bacterium]|nr:hypothetical protein [Pirellulales bacterium]